MANEVIIDPRYLKYDRADVEALLDKVHDADLAPTPDSGNMISSGAVAAALQDYVTTADLAAAVATEENVRGIVSNYTPDGDDGPSEG